MGGTESLLRILSQTEEADTMRILGIDPGYAIVGFGIVSYHGADFTPLEYGAITTEAGTRFAARLTAIYDDLDYLLKRFQPDCIAIERLYFTSNQKTVIDVAQARGVIVLCAEQHQIPMYEYTPLHVVDSALYRQDILICNCIRY